MKGIKTDNICNNKSERNEQPKVEDVHIHMQFYIKIKGFKKSKMDLRNEWKSVSKDLQNNSPQNVKEIFQIFE